MAEIDTTVAPLRQLEASRLIEQMVELGDVAERHYLELKSTLDLSTKRDQAAIAKFILGAANRLTDVALRAFEGYGVMAIGVSADGVVGIPVMEAMELWKRLEPFLGPNGPRWDVQWVPVQDSDRSVLLILVDPPCAAQPVFVCRADGDKVKSGRIYFRGEGETREASAEEFDLIRARELEGSRRDVDFQVELIGEVGRVVVDPERTLEPYIEEQRGRLTSALPPKASANEPFPGFNAVMAQMASVQDSFSLATGAFEKEDRTGEDYRAAIERWERQTREAWPKFVTAVVGASLAPAQVRITNRVKTFFEGVELEVHLAGDVMAFDVADANDGEALVRRTLPGTPRTWGLRKTTILPGFGAYQAAHYTETISPYIPALPSSVRFENTGSVTIEADIGELRPGRSHTTDEAESVLLVTDPLLDEIRASWTVTAQGHHDAYTGELTVPVSASRDLTNYVRHVLGLSHRDVIDMADD